MFGGSNGDTTSVRSSEYATAAERPKLYVNYTAAEAKITAPTIVSPSPADGTNWNENVTLNVSHSSTLNDVGYYLYLGDTSTLTENHLYLNNATRNASEWKSFYTNLTDGEYFWKFKVINRTDHLFSINTSQKSFIIDTAKPVITLGSNNNFSITNLTILNPYRQNLSINISFFDVNLYQNLINFTNKTSSVFFILNTTITGTTANYSRLINISSWAIGNYTIRAVATDSHTSSEIPKYDVTSGWDYFRYDTPEGNVITIESDSLPLTKKTTQLLDRYTFEFSYLTNKETYRYLVKSYSKIIYLPNSEYPGHFVIISQNGRGNWVDFGGINKKDISVTKLDDYTYEVEVTSGGKKSFTFSSIGGLNMIEKHYLLRLGAIVDVWVKDSESGQALNATATIGVQSFNTVSNVSAAQFSNITRETTTITLNATGYGIEVKDMTITEKYHNLTFDMTEVSAIKAFFYDESSSTLIEGETFSIYMEKLGYSATFTADTNPYTLTNLGSGLYDLKASSTNYPERQFFDLNVSNITTTNINIYLINSTIGAEKTFYVRSSSITAIEDVYINFTRVINGTRITVASEFTDYDGAAKLYLDEDYEYRIIFEKEGYNTKTINLEPTEDTYIINLIGSTEIYNYSVYGGITYKFEPSNIILNNNTNYNFTFTLNSSHWALTNCTLYLKNGSDILNTTSSYNPDSCYLRIEYFVSDITNITSEAVYELDNLYNFTVSHQYRVLYSYVGEFSLKSFLDDLTDFGMAGFDSFGRMILAIIAIIFILYYSAKYIGLGGVGNEITLIIIVWAAVGFFSYLGWFYLDIASMPDYTRLKKYFIFFLITLISSALIFRRVKD